MLILDSVLGGGDRICGGDFVMTWAHAAFIQDFVQRVLAEHREGVNVIKSRSQPITARDLGSAVSSPAPPEGSGAEPEPPMILVQFRG